MTKKQFKEEMTEILESIFTSIKDLEAILYDEDGVYYDVLKELIEEGKITKDEYSWMEETLVDYHDKVYDALEEIKKRYREFKEQIESFIEEKVGD